MSIVRSRAPKLQIVLHPPTTQVYTCPAQLVMKSREAVANFPQKSQCPEEI